MRYLCLLTLYIRIIAFRDKQNSTTSKMKFKQFFSIFFIFVFVFSIVNSVLVAAQVPPPPPPPSNQAPTLSGVPDQTLQEDSGLNNNIIDLFSYANDDFDTDSQLTFSINSQSNTAVVSCSIDSDRYIDCTTQTNQNGFSDVSVRVTDTNDATNTDTFRVTVSPVNDAPIANAQTVVPAINEDTPVAITLTASDIDGTIALWNTPAATLNGGTLTGTAPSLTYTPPINFNGADSFTFTVTDNGGSTSAAATVSITVTAVNDAPVASNDAYTTSEDAPLVVNAASGVLSNDNDIDGSTLTANLTTSASFGTLTLNLDGSFTYIPNANFNGADSFTYQANDGTGNSNTATATITINIANDAPTANAQTVTTNEETPVLINLTGSDVEGSGLIFTIISNPSNGILSGIAGNTVTYTPNANFFGTDTFTFKVNDGFLDSNTTAVAIIVGAVNDGPSIQITNPLPNSLFVEGSAVQVTAAATDPDNNPLTFTVNFGDGITSSGNVVNNQLVTSHVYENRGVYSIIAAITDGTLTSSQTIQVTILSYTINIIADKTSGTAPLTVNFNAENNGGNQPLSYAWDFNSDGTIDSTIKAPTALFGEEGEFAVKLTVTDANGDKATATVKIKVKDAPSSLPRNKVHIGQISFPDEAKAGENLEVLVNLENTNSLDTKELSATVVIPELGLRKKTGSERLREGESISKKILIEIPHDTKPGIYDVLIEINDHDTNRRRYRQIEII